MTSRGRLRLAFWGLAALLALQLIAVAAVTLSRARDPSRDARFPLPAQAAAIVALIERAAAAPEPEALAVALRAINGSDLIAQVIEGPLEPAPERRMPTVERVLATYLEALGGREVAVYLAGEASPRFRLEPRGLWSADPLRMEIALAGGGRLRLEAQGALERRLYGWPIGLGAGVLGLVLSVWALRILWRETRALPSLAERLDRFADAAQPTPMPEEGPEAVRAVIAAFNRMQTRLGALLRTRAVMIGALGHDLRTYLTRLRLRVELIDDADQRARAERDLAAMARTLENALAYAAGAADALARGPVPLAPLLARLAEPSGATVSAPEGLAAHGDADAIARILGNLLDNSVRYAGGPITIEAARAGEDVVVAVLDRGPGFPPECRDRLLEPFERGSRARNLDTPGSGLGLAIAADLARAMGGAVALLDREGGGARAELRLPRARGLEAGDAGPELA